MLNQLVGGVSRYELLDYTSSTSQHRLRHYNAERLRGALVDDELERARLLDGQVPGIRSPEDLLNVDGRMSEQFGIRRRIRHEAAVHDVFGRSVHAWELVLQRQIGDDFALGIH